MRIAGEVTRWEKHRDGAGRVIGLDLWTGGPGSGEVLLGLAVPEDSLGDGSVRMGAEVYALPEGVMDVLERIGDDHSGVFLDAPT
jgi:hypothetical protein